MKLHMAADCQEVDNVMYVIRQILIQNQECGYRVDQRKAAKGYEKAIFERIRVLDEVTSELFVLNCGQLKIRNRMDATNVLVHVKFKS
jgi:hypothetical protein